jgi:hypothetical protein
MSFRPPVMESKPVASAMASSAWNVPSCWTMPSGVKRTMGLVRVSMTSTLG